MQLPTRGFWASDYSKVLFPSSTPDCQNNTSNINKPACSWQGSYMILATDLFQTTTNAQFVFQIKGIKSPAFTSNDPIIITTTDGTYNVDQCSPQVTGLTSKTTTISITPLYSRSTQRQHQHQS